MPKLIAHLHVTPFGGLTRASDIFSDSFPFVISRGKPKFHGIEIASAEYPDEGKSVSREPHLILIRLNANGCFSAQSKINTEPKPNESESCCFLNKIGLPKVFEIHFNEIIVLGAPTGPGTVAIKLTKPV